MPPRVVDPYRRDRAPTCRSGAPWSKGRYGACLVFCVAIRPR